MSVSSVNNKRIAKNTLFLYFRQILVMAVSLYTVRVVLEVLGEEDYGIYNVVGGFVALFNILSGALSVAIGRFITYEMGQPDATTLRLRRIFSSSLLIQIAMGLVISLLIGTFGVWFVAHKMVIPSDRLGVTFYVLGFSVLSFFINLLSVPYNALIIAHEQMKAFAYISIIEVVLKLLVAYLLLISPVDKLWLYALSMVLVALIVRFTYVLYCKRHFAECRFLWGFDRRLLSRMFAFSGWAFLGNGAIVLKDQGSNVLLNLFGGLAVNAARGIAMQVNAAVYSFVMNFMQASNPQITKNYASGNLEAMYSLIIRCSKFSFFIMLMILLPLCAGVDYVLRLWLVDVPAHTVNFVVLTLLYSLVECFLNPLITGMLAQGNIKSFEIGLASLYTVNFMASYVCLKLGMPVETVFVLNIVFKALVLVVLLIHSKLKFAFPVARFCKECLSFSLAVFLLSALFIYILPGKEYGGLVCFGVRTFAIMAFIGVAVILIGMTREERDYVVRILKERLSRAQ